MAHREERETTSLDLEAGWASLTRPVASRLVTAGGGRLESVTLVVVDSDGNGHAGEVAEGEQVGGHQT